MTAAQVLRSPSWAAFVFAPLYFVFMRAFLPAAILTAALFIPVANLIAWIYYGIVGKRIAWQSRRWHDFDEFLACQRAWDRAAKTTLAISLVTTALAAYWWSQAICCPPPP